MKIKVPKAAAILGVLSLVPFPSLAHHGSSAYDITKLITTKATVMSLNWSNPHCTLRFNVTDERGVATTWTLELYNPLWMGRAGWTKQTLKPGDEIVVTFHPAKNGTANGYIRIPESKIVFRGQSLNLDENGSETGSAATTN